jgi:hypothetical protein
MSFQRSKVGKLKQEEYLENIKPDKAERNNEAEKGAENKILIPEESRLVYLRV